MDTAQRIARRLLEVEAIKLNTREPFIWASGRKAPIYCDNRILLSYPDIRREVIEAFRECSQAWGEVEAVAGVATAGIAHGALLAEALHLPFLYVRSAPKGHGRKNQIEGRLVPGRRTLVIEDLISTGGSCLKAVEALRKAGAEVIGVLAIFSYGFPESTRAFARAGVPFQTLTHYEALLREAIARKAIGQDELSTLQQWRLDPAHWKAG